MNNDTTVFSQTKQKCPGEILSAHVQPGKVFMCMYKQVRFLPCIQPGESFVCTCKQVKFLVGMLQVRFFSAYEVIHYTTHQLIHSERCLNFSGPTRRRLLYSSFRQLRIQRFTPLLLSTERNSQHKRTSKVFVCMCLCVRAHACVSFCVCDNQTSTSVNGIGN